MAVNPAGGSVRPTLSVVYGLGMLTIFVGERVVSVGAGARIVSAVGFVAVLAALVLRLRARGGATPDRRTEHAVLSMLYLTGAVALVGYAVSSDWLQWATGRALDRRAPALDSLLELVWPALWIVGCLPVPLVDAAAAAMRKAPVHEHDRIRAAASAGLGAAFAIVTAVALGLAGKHSDVRVDVSYFRTAKAGEATLKLARSLTKPVKVLLFFPEHNEVGEEVDRYFADLAQSSRLLTVEHHDHALEPGTGADYQVTGNGIIVLAREGQQRQIGLSTVMDRARQDLKRLDQEVNRHLMALSRPPKIAYFTTGHDENRFEPADETDRRRPIGGLQDVLSAQGFEVRELGVAQGSTTEVPGDASIVLIVGPRRPFMKEELAALASWVRRGGRLLIALDPESGADYAELLRPLGVRFVPRPLANDVAYWKRTSQPNDRYNLATSTFGTHVAVTTLSKMGARAPLVFLGAGMLQKREDAPPDVTVSPAIQSDANSWVDGNLNFENDQGEERKVFDLAYAIAVRGPHVQHDQFEGRVLVLADADVLTNLAMQSLGNTFLFMDTVRWLSGEEKLVGAINSEDDVRIAHTRKQDLAWFYSTVFLFPVAILAFGVVKTRRRRMGRSREARKAAGAAPTEPRAGTAPEGRA